MNQSDSLVPDVLGIDREYAHACADLAGAVIRQALGDVGAGYLADRDFTRWCEAAGCDAGIMRAEIMRVLTGRARRALVDVND